MKHAERTLAVALAIAFAAAGAEAGLPLQKKAKEIDPAWLKEYQPAR